MAQEVSSEDGVLHVCNNEGPSEGSTEAQVQAEGMHTISRDRRLVSSLQGGSCGGGGAVTTGGRNDTHLSTGVHKKAQVAGPVHDEKQATRWSPTALGPAVSRPRAGGGTLLGHVPKAAMVPAKSLSLGRGGRGSTGGSTGWGAGAGATGAVGGELQR